MRPTKLTGVLSILGMAAVLALAVAIAPHGAVMAQVNSFFTALPTATGTNSFKMAESGFGAKQIYGTNTELLTLSTGSVNSTTTGSLLPANSIIESVTGEVVTTITGGCTGWSLDDGTTATRFSANNTTLTAGTSVPGINMWNGVVASTAAGPTQAAASTVRVVCAGAAASAGQIRITVTYRTVVPDFL